MYVLAMQVDLRIPHSGSLKDKRQVVKGLLEGSRRRFGVSAAEVGAQDSWQRAILGFAVVASSVHQAEEVLDSLDSFVWSRPELEVISAERIWLETD
jgi:uncharacterized protein YlxP (DUF503 family)